MRLPTRATDAIPTFCTDGAEILYNPGFLARLTDPELRFVLAHEVMHCAQNHLTRKGNRDMAKWNYACDYAVNLLLADYIKDCGGQKPPWSVPADALLDQNFRDLSAEEIYARLPDSAGGYPQSPGAFVEPVSETKAMELEQDWTIAVAQAITVARMQGSVPDSLSRFVDQVLQPKVSWREVLREFFRAQTRDDYAWSRPNRRYVGHGLVMPSLYAERMGRLVIAVDTSGSINDTTLAEFQAEIQSALDDCSPESIEVLYCDAQINGRDEFYPGDAVHLRAIGGGGTDFCPVFDHIRDSHGDPVALVYLTDGYGSFPKQEPSYPVLWATIGTQQFPFGRVVSVN